MTSARRGGTPRRAPAPDHGAMTVRGIDHIGLTVPDLEAAESQVLALGARPLDTRPDRSFRVYADPSGHPFCLCRQ
nr:VOC family protein [Streptomyces sp. McG2]